MRTSLPDVQIRLALDPAGRDNESMRFLADRPRRACIFDIGRRAFAEASERAPAAIWGDSALL